MKKYFIIILVCLGFNSYAQQRITVAATAAETFIESYEKSIFDESTLNAAYRLGPTSAKTLKEGIKTAIKWIDLNSTHQKDFEKEICRFKAMKKKVYKFHGYVEQFTLEMTLNFKGNSDGTFAVEIKQYDSHSKFIIFSDIDGIVSFSNLLDGKSANKEIDDVFTK